MNGLATIGGYGFAEVSFYETLRQAGVTIFCDLRARRGVRGSQYAFLNSLRLQEGLRQRGIRYVHLPDLAPSDEVRSLQHHEDEEHGIGKRSREELSPLFIEAYLREVGVRLSVPEPKTLGEKVALFCVETRPAACHRSIVAEAWARATGLPVEDLFPPDFTTAHR